MKVGMVVTRNQEVICLAEGYDSALEAVKRHCVFVKAKMIDVSPGETPLDPTEILAERVNDEGETEQVEYMIVPSPIAE